MAIDNQTRRRTTNTGLTAFDKDRACPGYVIYSPMNGPGDVCLINLDGDEVHHWEMTYPPGLYGYLLPNGNVLIFNNGSHSLKEPLPFSRVVEVDPKSNRIVWETGKPRLQFF